MKIVSKAAVHKFSNKDYTMHTALELMGRAPHHIPKFIRLRGLVDLSLVTITEGMGNIYSEDKSFGKLTQIETVSFTWNIDVTQIPTIRFTRSCNDALIPGNETVIYLDEPYFAPGDVAALENTQQLYFLTRDTKISDTEYAYTVKLVGSPSEVLNNRFTQAQTGILRYVYNAQPEYSQRGYNKLHTNLEKHQNWMTKIRSSQTYSQDYRATQEYYIMDEQDLAKAERFNGGNYTIYKMSPIEQQVFEHFLRSVNGFLAMGRSNIDPRTGRPTTQDEQGQDVIIGDGMIAQYERYAQYIPYNTGGLSVKHFKDALQHVRDKRGRSTGNHITVLCNRRFFDAGADALQTELFKNNPYGAWFYTKDKMNKKDPVTQKPGTNKYRLDNANLPNEVAVGATFNTYIWQGNTVTFMIDESLTYYYPTKGYALFIDTGLYTDEKGNNVPAVSLYTLKGRELIKSSMFGPGGISGSSSGNVSQSVDAGMYDILGWRGVAVHNPYAATIMVENV